VGETPHREVLSWPEYGTGIRDLARQVAEDGYRPDIVLAIARGGLIPAGSLSYALSVKNTYVLNAEYYTGVDQRHDVPVMLPPYLDLIGVEDKQFLIVDDVADTGHTLAMVRDFCAGKVGEARTAVIYEKSQSVIRCDYVWRRTDAWVEFPWSRDDPVAAPKPGVTIAPER
jgi:uncharacterized protein